MKGSYDLQKWLMNEYSNDSLDFSVEGLVNECVEYIEDMQRQLSDMPITQIKQELKADINTNLESLKKKINEILAKNQNNAGF
jgi:hypothetical protein